MQEGALAVQSKHVYFIGIRYINTLFEAYSQEKAHPVIGQESRDRSLIVLLSLAF
jgi:hypothetical protein